jgi:hypothetical protein
MIDRFMTVESGVLNAHHQRNQENTIRANLKNNSTACFMVTSCDLFQDRPTVCVTSRWADVDSAWEQEKPEARKMLENGDKTHLSIARFVSPP